MPEVAECYGLPTMSDSINGHNLSAEIVATMRRRYEDAGQQHVFAHVDELNKEERDQLHLQARSIDVEHVNEIFNKAIQRMEPDTRPHIEPLPEGREFSIENIEDSEFAQWNGLGRQLISEGKVAVVLMAGGQGTRLGSSDPKGCYDVGLPSKKCLFELQADQIRSLGRVPWYIMTSAATYESTRQFFRRCDYFGLDPKDVIMFPQGNLPCFETNGKIIMETASKIALSPDGNGGIYRALVKHGVLADMKARGIEHVHMYSVDNVLAHVADPIFIGCGAARNLSICTKSVRKEKAGEAVGLIVASDGRPAVIEYSEISTDDAQAKVKLSNGKEVLKFRCANIVNHYFSIEALAQSGSWADILPHHIATKKIPQWDAANKEIIKPSKPNGIKLEQFVFDVFPLVEMRNFGCLEVSRPEEFAVLKNARGTGSDDPDTCKTAFLSRGKRWVEAFGGKVEDEQGIEVSGFRFYKGQGLENMVKGQVYGSNAAIIQ